MLKERPKNSAAAKLLHDIDALNPPEISIAPVAPFVGEQQLADGFAAAFRDEINSFRGVTEQGAHAERHPRRVECQQLGFPGKAYVAVRDELRVGKRGWSDDYFDGAMLMSGPIESMLSPGFGCIILAVMDEPMQLPIDGVLDLHTFQPREVKNLVLDYLAACREKGVCEVRIIHGKGIGQLRRTVHAILEKHSQVISFTLDHPQFGGWGATLVRLEPAGKK